MPGSPIIETFKQRMERQDKMTIVAYGDSWTYGSVAEGWYEARDRGYDSSLITGSWASMLRDVVAARNAQAAVFNEGVGGWTAPRGLEAYAEKVAPHRPDYVILNFGINDWKNGLPLADYEAAMNAIVARVKEDGGQAVLWTSGPLSVAGVQTYGWPQPWDGSKLAHTFAEFTAALHRLAEAHDLPLADAAADIEALHASGEDLRDWFFDSIHFKQQGHDMILRRIAATLGLPE
ncbi:MAG: SGNH/GDSL hydrolase family protein [Paenibacillaceae bacterium]|nr:SGNH/GDSL hydrolase family protein [Paenibacillaceae bacterium]